MILHFYVIRTNTNYLVLLRAFVGINCKKTRCSSVVQFFGTVLLYLGFMITFPSVSSFCAPRAVMGKHVHAFLKSRVCTRSGIPSN